MHDLKIMIKNSSSFKPVLFVNDKQIKIKNEKGKLVGRIDCDSVAHVKIFNYHPLNYPFGILIGYFFFLISLLGIFDQHYSAKSRRVLFEADVEVNSSTELMIHFEEFHLDKEFITYTCSNPIRVIENKCFVDYSLQKKIRILFALKVLTWLAIPIILIIVILKSII